MRRDYTQSQKVCKNSDTIVHWIINWNSVPSEIDTFDSLRQLPQYAREINQYHVICANSMATRR